MATRLPISGRLNDQARLWSAAVSAASSGQDARAPSGQASSRRLVCCAALLAALIAGTRPAAADEQQVWELTPYRIQLIVAFAPHPELTPQLQADVRAYLAERIAALQGAAWDVTIVPAARSLQARISAAIENIAAESLPQESLKFDKVMLLAVSAAEGGYQATAREFDVRTATWSTPVERPARQLFKLRDAAVSAVFRAFAPLAKLSGVRDGQAVLRLRAAALPPRDRDLRPVQPGDVFLPVMRRAGDQRQSDRILPIPWTFCTVEEITAEEVRCRLESGLRSPLESRPSAHVEILALGVVPPQRPSTLVLQSAAQPRQALSGYEVYVARAGAQQPVPLGRTDRQGQLLVPPGEEPLRVLLVRYGSEQVARLPLVPGLQSRLVATLPQEERQIEAEEFLSSLEDDLIDLCARRAFLLNGAQARLQARQFGQAEQFLAELRKLPEGPEFARSRAGELAKSVSADPAVQSRLEARLAEIQQVLGAQGDRKAVEQLAEQLRKSKGAP